jgi:hypothetical protein
VVTNKAFPTAVGALPLIQPSPSPDGLVLSGAPAAARPLRLDA